MKKLLIIILVILITACSEDKKLNSDYFYNTGQAHQGKLCNSLKNQWTWSFKLDSLKVIYACYQNDLDTRFTVTDNDFDKVYKDLYLPNVKLYPWTLTYDSKTIIAIKENSLDKQSKELVSIDLGTKEIKTLSVLPYNTYWFSEHPLSENGILIFNANINDVDIFDLNTEKLNREIFKSQNSPIISKDGKKVLFVLDEDVYLYTIDTRARDLIYSSKEIGRYKAFSAFFGDGNEIIIKGVKNPNIKPLQQIEYLVIKNKEIVKKGQIDFKKGYKYY